MLLATLALVLQGALPVMAHRVVAALATDAGTTHADCHGHDGRPDQPAAAHDSAEGHDSAGLQLSGPGPLAVVDQDQTPAKSLPPHCCTAVTAAVLPAGGFAGHRRIFGEARVAARPSPLREGLSPEGPSKPPRTSYQG